MFGDQSLFTIEGYKVIRQLAEGSFGQICQIMELQTQKSYALKALLKSYLVKTDTMKEARLQALLLEVLDHPGIVKLHEMRQDNDFLYLIMQLGGRGDLKDLLSKTTTPEQWKPETKKTLAQILDTIAYLHSNGISHCDIKPENIVVMNKGNPKLVDFGAARIFDRQLVSADVLERWDNYLNHEKTIGSPQFISPEGIKGQIGPARDVWAFGVLSYWIFHGKLPFTGNSHLQIFENIRNTQPQMQETLGESAKALIRDCLQKDPNCRPTAAQLKFSDYFQQVDFKHLFSQKQKVKQKVLLSNDVQKKMFFGNYKARILKITVQENELFLSYCYPSSGTVKNKIKLQPSDFAEVQNETQFFVRTREKKFYFKTNTYSNTLKCANGINQSIKTHFQL